MKKRGGLPQKPCRLRTIGFFSSPEVLRILAIIPIMGAILNFIVGIWNWWRWSLLSGRRLIIRSLGEQLVSVSSAGSFRPSFSLCFFGWQGD
jgi:hypothetical protein